MRENDANIESDCGDVVQPLNKGPILKLSQRHIVAAKQPMIDILEEERKDQFKQANLEEAEGQAVAGDDFDKYASFFEEYG